MITNYYFYKEWLRSCSGRVSSFDLTKAPKSCSSQRTRDKHNKIIIGIRGTELSTVIDNTVSSAPDCSIPAVTRASNTAQTTRLQRRGSSSQGRFFAQILEITYAEESIVVAEKIIDKIVNKANVILPNGNDSITRAFTYDMPCVVKILDTSSNPLDSR